MTPEQVERLAAIQTIDLTTFGRRSGQPRRIEIWWFHVDERFIITGTPGPRDWLANVRNDSRVIIHVDGLDIEAHVELIDDPVLRRQVFTASSTSWYSTQAELEALIAESPMVEVIFPTG